MIHPATDLPPSPGGYDADVPCAACGYNLRGLELEGSCPECGHSNATSLAAWKRRLAADPDPITNYRWAAAMQEDAFLSLLSFILVFGLAVIPGWM